MSKQPRPTKSLLRNALISVGILLFTAGLTYALSIYLHERQVDAAYAEWKERTLACDERWNDVWDQYFKYFEQQDDGETRLYRSDAIYYSQKHGSCILYMPIRLNIQYAIINESGVSEFMEVIGTHNTFMNSIVFDNDENLYKGWRRSSDIPRIEDPCCD
mgnify:CR=1 FL=1